MRNLARFLSLIAFVIFGIIGCTTSTDLPEIPVVPESDNITPENDLVTATTYTGTSIRVLWNLSDIVFGKEFTGNRQKARDLLFKPLNVTETQIIFNGLVCENVTFTTEIVSAKDYLLGWYDVSPIKFNVKDDDIKIIKTNCDYFGFKEYFRANDGRLIIPFEGAFYIFTPAYDK